jgi:enamine deaminase RidA (YjgF/YER057c/UK114 family)
MSFSSIERINPPTLPTPPGYSQLVVVPGGTLIVIAGQVALDANGTLVGPGDFALQTTQVFRNLIAALEAAGAGPRNLIPSGGVSGIPGVSIGCEACSLS